MKRLLHFFAIILISFIAGCSKDFPAKDDESAVFYFKATINGQTININAGDDGYYMFSQHQQDANNVYKYIADLRNGNGNALSIEINDDTVTMQGGSSNIIGLIPAYYNYEGTSGNVTKFRVDFTAIPDVNRTTSMYIWDFKDGEIDTTITPTIQHFYKHPGNYDVNCNIIYTDGCKRNLSNEVSLGMANSSYTANFTNSYVGTSSYQFISSYSGTALSYDWDFGDQTPHSTIANPTHTYLTYGIHTVSLSVMNSDGITICPSVTKHIADSGYTASCLTNFNHSIVSYINPFKYSNVKISWTDNAGIKYTSDLANQIKYSFQVLSVEEYKTNEKGEPTKKIRIKFDCDLSNGTTTIPVRGAQAILAVSYK